MLTLENYKGEFDLEPAVNPLLQNIRAYIREQNKGVLSFLEEVRLEAELFDTAAERDAFTKAMELKLVQKEDLFYSYFWKPEEDAFIREHYGILTRVTIAKRLHRSFYAVQSRTRILFTPEQVRAGIHSEWKKYGRLNVGEEINRYSRTERGNLRELHKEKIRREDY